MMGMVEPVVSLAEARAYLRIETGDEEALLAGLIRSATAVCESFLGTLLLERTFSVELAPSTSWQRLEVAPVRSIDNLSGVLPDGTATALPATAYAVDVDSSGYGWVRLTGAIDATRLRVEGLAGLGPSPSDVPEPVRQGVLRLTAHMFSDRDGMGGAPPAAVTALWRPYRRLRLS